MDMIQNLDEFRDKCADQLFEMQNSYNKGELVMETEKMKELNEYIEEICEDFDVYELQMDQLDLIRKHNRRADEFTPKIRENIYKMDGLDKFDDEDDVDEAM